MVKSISTRQKRAPKSSMEASGRKKKASNDEKSINHSKRGNNQSKRGTNSTRMKKGMNNAKPKPVPVENPNATPIPQDVENPFIILRCYRNELLSVLSAIKGVVQKNTGVLSLSKAGMRLVQAPEGQDEYEMMCAMLSRQKIFDSFEHLEKMKQISEKQAKMNREHQEATEKLFEPAQKFVMDEFNEIADMHVQLLKTRDEMDQKVVLNAEAGKAKEDFQNQSNKLAAKLKEFHDISEKHVELITQWTELHQQFHVAMAKVLEEGGIPDE